MRAAAVRSVCVSGIALPHVSQPEKNDDDDYPRQQASLLPAKRPGGFFRVLGSWVNGIVTYFAHREAIKTLSKLDDRALRDIGIERARIESAVRGVVDPEFGRIR